MKDTHSYVAKKRTTELETEPTKQPLPWGVYSKFVTHSGKRTTYLNAAAFRDRRVALWFKRKMETRKPDF
jgi:hypothetical protein